MEPHPEINLIIVADHGMMDIPDVEHLKYLNDYVPDEMIQRTLPDCGTYCKLTPAENYTSQDILDKLKPLFDATGWRYYK